MNAYDAAQLLKELERAQRALVALIAGTHGEPDVNPNWVLATALQGLGAGRPGASSSFLYGER